MTGNFLLKDRIDVLLVKKGLVSSREKAKELVKNGLVKVGDKIITKPSREFFETENIVVLEGFKFVSRAGYKLDKAILEFGIEILGKVCLDIGSSTGGFVDCLLQKGAKKVFAVEIGKGVMDMKIAQDLRVVNMEGVDALSDFVLGEKVDFCSIDATFVSLENLMPNLKKHFVKKCEIVALIKPPFEVEALKLKKVTDEDVLKSVVLGVSKSLKNLGFKVVKVIESPISGKGAKQKEFLALITN